MRLIVSVLLLVTSAPVFAYQSIMTTGDIVRQGRFEVMGETQFITSQDEGVNIVGRVEGGLSESTGYRAEVGFGATGFHLGGYYKWVPIPDVNSQPAIGALFGATFGRFADSSTSSLRGVPFLSKYYLTKDNGAFNFYGALPISMRSSGGENEIPIQLVGGGHWKTLSFKHVTLFGELGLSLQKSFNYISFGVKFDLDENHRLQFE